MKQVFAAALCIAMMALTACHHKRCEEECGKPALATKEYTVAATLYQQQAGEYRALCYQAFNLAKLRLDAELKTPREAPNAIITDVDETILDNSCYQTWLIKNNLEYRDSTWKLWCKQMKATAVPGALEFLKYAASKGISVYYISNRDTSLVECTRQNLEALGFPNCWVADKERYFLFKAGKESSKKERQMKVEHATWTFLYLGDNLNDFPEEFDRKPNSQRNGIIDSLHTTFNYKYIMLPNVMYGAWEDAMYNYYKDKPTTAQKDSIRKELLKGY